MHGPFIHDHHTHCKHYYDECDISYCCSCGKKWSYPRPWDGYYSPWRFDKIKLKATAHNHSH